MDRGMRKDTHSPEGVRQSLNTLVNHKNYDHEAKHSARGQGGGWLMAKQHTVAGCEQLISPLAWPRLSDFSSLMLSAGLEHWRRKATAWNEIIDQCAGIAHSVERQTQGSQYDRMQYLKMERTPNWWERRTETNSTMQRLFNRTKRRDKQPEEEEETAAGIKFNIVFINVSVTRSAVDSNAHQ